MSWETGAADINAALKAGELQKVSGAQAAGDAWIADARTKLATARTIATSDPATAYITAYDAARFALVGLLAQQGLRATQRGGHLAVEHAARAIRHPIRRLRNPAPPARRTRIPTLSRRGRRILRSRPCDRDWRPYCRQSRNSAAAPDPVLNPGATGPASFFTPTLNMRATCA